MPEEAPTTHTSTAPSSAQTAIAARLSELFPNGVLPEPTPLRSGEKAPGDPGYRAPEGQTGPTGGPGVTGQTGPAATGATGAATTGPTGAPTGATGVSGTTGPADVVTGPTGAASGPAASGPTDAQLDEAGKKMDIKAGTAFKHVRDQNAELTKANADLVAKLKAKEGASGAPADTAEVTELRAKVARYEGELAISKVEATDAFKNEISKPLAKANTDLQAIIGKYQVPAADFAAALANPDPIARTDKLSELSANFNRMDLVRFDQLIGKIDQLNDRRQSEISNAAEKWKTIQAQRDAEASQAASAFDSNWKSALQTAAGKLESDGFFKPTGKPERDAEIAKVQAMVKNMDVAKMSNEDLASSLYKAYAFPLLLEELSAAMATIGEKEARILKLSGTSAAPAGNGQVPTVAETGPKKVDQTASFAGTMKTALQGVLPP